MIGGGGEGMPASVFAGLGLSLIGYIALQNVLAGGPVIFVINIVFSIVTLRCGLNQLT